MGNVYKKIETDRMTKLLKTRYLYKKFVCVFIVFIMLILGIRVPETQTDSFFSLTESEQHSVFINDTSQPIDLVCYISSRYNGFCEEIWEKVRRNRKKNLYGEEDTICPQIILHTNLFVAFQKTDSKVGKPERLTDFFIILFIHNQDGLKWKTLLF